MKQSTKHLRTLLCLVLSLTLVLSMSGAIAAQAEGKETTVPTTATRVGDGGEEVTYELVAQNNATAMYADMAKGYFYLQDLKTGQQWHSTVQDAEDEGNFTSGLNMSTTRSQLLLEYVDRSIEIFTEHPERTNSYLECVDSSAGGSITVTKIEKGIRVDYYFGTVLNITVPVTYVLNDAGYLEASVLNGEGKDGIQDAPAGSKEGFAVAAVRLLPAFGAGNWKDQGYLFVPDGSGTLVHFNNKNVMATEYREPVYGTDKLLVAEESSTKLETIRVPVFGTVNGAAGLMGVITEGDAIADITVMNGNATCAYNAVSSIFNYRVMSTQYNMYNKRRVAVLVDNATDLEAYTVRYYTLTGDDADYIGMANAYRQYLINEKGFKKRDTAPTFHVNMIGMYETPASILGVIPYTKKVSLTTYKQAQDILDDLRASGMTSLSATYTGWSNNGITNVKIPKAATTLSVLGKKKAFNALKESVANFAPSTDLLTFQKSGNGVNINKHAIRSAFNKIMKQPQYMLSVYVTQIGGTQTAHLSATKLTDVAARYLASLKKQGISQIDLGNLGDYCYSSYNEKDTVLRTSFTKAVADVLKQYDEAGIKVTVSGGNAYTLPYVDVVTNVPTHSSGYDIFDEDVPFFQAVLHGYVPYTTVSIPQSGNPEYTYLSAVESGTELNYIGIYEDAGDLFDTPYNYLYSSTWTLWKDMAAEQYKAYQPLLESVKDQTIVDHYCAAERVYVTTYANGVAVAVNYTEKTVAVDGHEVPATGFTTWEVKA